VAFILIIDDDENLYQRAAEALVPAGHACGCAKSPDQARDLLRLRNPDLILIDRESTGVSLDPLLGELDLHPRDIPVVTLSSVSGGETGSGKSCTASRTASASHSTRAS
jgi:DNA-binding response OmpR family regulator